MLSSGCRRGRRGRADAGPRPRRRHRGRHPAPAAGLPDGDRAAAGLLPRQPDQRGRVGEVDEITARALDALAARRDGGLAGAGAIGWSRSRPPVSSGDAAAGLVVARTLAAGQRGRSARREHGRAGRDRRAASATRARCRRSRATTGSRRRICASVNNRVVHGIPSRRRCSPTATCISVDCGAILDGWHGDSAVTCPVGAVSAADLALSARDPRVDAGRDRGRAGRQPAHRHLARHRDRRCTRPSAADGVSYGIVPDYGGHGIGRAMHMEPFLPNTASRAGPAAALRDGHGGRADAHHGHRARPRSSTTAGPSSPPTAPRRPLGAHRRGHRGRPVGADRARGVREGRLELRGVRHQGLTQHDALQLGTRSLAQAGEASGLRTATGNWSTRCSGAGLRSWTPCRPTGVTPRATSWSSTVAATAPAS